MSLSMCGECGGVLDAHRCVDCDTAHNGHVAWSAMCGDRVVVNGWTGRVVAQHGPYSGVSMEATNSPQTHATSQLVQWPDPPQPTLTGDCDGCPTPTDGCPGDCPQRASTILDVPVDRATSKEIKRLVGKIEKLLDERDVLIRRARDEGASLREIAELLHVNHVTVKNLLEKPPRSHAPKRRSARPEGRAVMTMKRVELIDELQDLALILDGYEGSLDYEWYRRAYNAMTQAAELLDADVVLGAPEASR